MKICVIGGGLCGLTAALDLSDEHTVAVLERDDRLGGCLASYHVDKYWIERYYHHCFSGDRQLLTLFDRLGIGSHLEWLKGTSGYWVEGNLYPLNTPMEIFRYPHLSLADKARLALLTLRAGRMDIAALDAVPARDFILSTLGERAYASFFEPLLKSKFGDARDDVSAAWLISRIAIRSDRGVGGERLGYLRGGFQVLIDRLAEALRDRGCIIRTGTPAASVEREGRGWRVNGEGFDAVLSTIPPQEIPLAGPPLPAVPYQGAACMTLGIDRDVLEGIYWVNMKDPAPYGAVIAHTNFAPIERYGEHIVYLASYFAERVPNGLPGRMLADFCRRFHLGRASIRWQRMAVNRFAGPVYRTGYRDLIPAYEQNGLFVAGMFSLPNYPERSMEGSVAAAHAAAERMRGADA
ncbi:MAG: NAD(P)/FAD-dependent oxidoreductase [Methanomicrobiales archaeon]|nr:NAD(P)/FAD-dependent oxidoreductase [Methanomicrobiales archaeon]MDI6875828.1 NAD(P)/FAD-dependent oxidoreductase [Methanomicrobiales archaeon]